jgi:hypothetical protein
VKIDPSLNLRQPGYRTGAELRHTSIVATVLKTSTLPAIVESYRDFEPPPNFRTTVETLLRYVPPKYLIGLKSVVLTNRAGLTRNKRRQKVWSRSHKVRLAESLGSYSSSTKSSPASVWLYVDNIVESGVRWFRWIPVLRYVVQGNVLYHEIGHHIHAEHRPVHEEREDVAEEWSSKLMKNFYRKHYWYIFPLLYVFARIASPIFKRLRTTA